MFLRRAEELFGERGCPIRFGFIPEVEAGVSKVHGALFRFLF
jgi:hypothetical protein